MFDPFTFSCFEFQFFDYYLCKLTELEALQFISLIQYILDNT